MNILLSRRSACLSKHPILRTYRYIKSSFRTEPYSYLVNDKHYRHAISQLRCSSHILNVEKGRYTWPRTPLGERLCNMGNCVDDELHFMTACAVNVNERRTLYDKLINKFPEFEHLCDLQKFVFLFTFDDAQILSWLGKFLYISIWLNPSKWSACRKWRNLFILPKVGRLALAPMHPYIYMYKHH